MQAVTEASFEREVLESEVPVVVEFWALWCAPCRRVEPVLEELARRHKGRMRVVRVDVDEEPSVAARYGVLSLPTAILFSGGTAREAVAGARPTAHYERAWARWLE